MNAATVAERVPIHTDAQGVVRVAGTRMTLETIDDAFETSATANRAGREALAWHVRGEAEQQFPSTGLRERLLARRQ